jgi:hypothetical protein
MLDETGKHESGQSIGKRQTGNSCIEPGTSATVSYESSIAGRFPRNDLHITVSERLGGPWLNRENGRPPQSKE